MNIAAGDKFSIITPLIVIVDWNSLLIWISADNVNFSSNGRCWIMVNTENEFIIERNNSFLFLFTCSSKDILYHYAMNQLKSWEFLYQLLFLHQLWKAGRGNFPSSGYVYANR